MLLPVFFTGIGNGPDALFLITSDLGLVLGFGCGGIYILFLLKVYFSVVWSYHFILQIGERLVGHDSELPSELHAPPAIHGYDTFLEVSIDKRVYVHDKITHLQIADKVFYLFLERVGEQQRRLYLSLAVARRTGFGSDYVECRTYTLACDLHQPELAQRQNIVPCAVIGHHFTHVFVQALAVFGLVHVYEVDHYYTSHIAQPQLSGYLFGSTHIYFEGIALLIVGGFRTVSAVDVYYV